MARTTIRRGDTDRIDRILARKANRRPRPPRATTRIAIRKETWV